MPIVILVRLNFRTSFPLSHIHEKKREGIDDINWHTKKEWGEPNHISTIDFGDDIIKSKNFFGLSKGLFGG